jgi:uncharacterized protein
VLTYVDSSVALAHLYRKPRAPAPSFWLQPIVSSRLLEYEIWNRLHAHGRGDSHGGKARDLLTGVQLLEMTRPILAPALGAFPLAVPTLDGLHLATMLFLRDASEEVELASYDNRLLAAAQALGISVAAL